MEKEEPPKIENLLLHIEEYIQTQKELSSLYIAEKTSQVSSAVISFLIIFLLFFFTIVFGSIALAFIISAHFGSNSIGFSVVALIYFLMGIILFLNRKKMLEVPLINSMINKYFQNENDGKN